MEGEYPTLEDRGMVKVRSLKQAAADAWLVTRHRRSFLLASGLTLLGILFTCLFGARLVVTSPGLDQSSTQKSAEADQQALHALISDVCNLPQDAPDNTCSISVRAAIFQAFNVSQAAIEQEVQQGHAPFAALHLSPLKCPQWEQAMQRLVANLGQLVQKKTITSAQSEEVVSWMQERQDSACAFTSSNGVTYLTPTPRPQTGGSCPPVPGYEDTTDEVRLLGVVNQARADNGVAPLTNDPLIQGEALQHSMAMTCYGMSHFVPPGTTPETRMRAAGVTFTWGGENIGWSGRGDSWTKVMWLFNTMMAEQPPNDGHRKNILSPHFTRTGIGLYVENVSARLWETEDFAG
jgi:uncharacterized protein YkwD